MDSTSDSRAESNPPEEAQPVILRACDMCRKKKIRCQPTSEGCAQCTKYKAKCHFTPIATKRRPRRPAGFKYIAKLEERLAEVEHLLRNKSSTQAAEHYDTSRDQQQREPSSHNTTALITSSTRSGGSPVMPMGELEPSFFERTSGSDIDQVVTFWGPDQSELDVTAIPGFGDNQPVLSWPIPETVSPPVALRAHQQLPSKALALELIGETFVNHNKFLPLFDENEFLKEFHLKYAISHPGDAAWWGCLNVVLSIAHLLRALRMRDPSHERTLAGGYLQNALSVISELNVSSRSLSAVQALVGMACILQGTPNPEPASMLVAAALRLAQAMNLHREFPNSSLTQAQAESRRRVFWKLYIIDKDISTRTGRAFSQDDSDMDVRLPSAPDPISSNVDLFKHRIGLAVIQGQVYKQLYSVSAERQTQAQRAMAAQELSSLLSYWKCSAQLQSPEDSEAQKAGHMSGIMIHQVVMRLTYVHCLTMIQRQMPHPSQPIVDPAFRLSEGRLPHDSVCIDESRISINLVNAIPPRDSACVWMLLHAFFAAASNILNHVTKHPASHRSYPDLNLVRPFLSLLETLSKDPRACSQSKELTLMHRACGDLHAEATKAVEFSR